MTDTTRAAYRGRADALVALERARQAYEASQMELPDDPSILKIAAAYAPPAPEYDGEQRAAYEAAWGDTIFTDAIARLTQRSLAPLLQRMKEAEAQHVCDESCAVAAAAECEKHGMLGMADTERGARLLTLEHLKSHHPRRAHHAIAKMTEELNE